MYQLMRSYLNYVKNDTHRIIIQYKNHNIYIMGLRGTPGTLCDVFMDGNSMKAPEIFEYKAHCEDLHHLRLKCV